MRRLAVLVGLVAASGCLIAPSSPDAIPDGGSVGDGATGDGANPDGRSDAPSLPDAVPADCQGLSPDAAHDASDFGGPIATLAEQDTFEDTVFRAGTHDGVPVIWRYKSPVTNLNCPAGRFDLDLDAGFAGVDAITTARIDRSGTVRSHVYVLVHDGNHDAFVHELVDGTGTGTYVDVATTRSTGGAPTRFPTSGDEVGPAFLTYVAAKSELWFGGGAALSHTAAPLTAGGASLVSDAFDSWYGAAALPGAGGPAVALVGAHGVWSAASGQSPSSIATYGVCAANQACAPRLASPLYHIVEARPLVGSSLALLESAVTPLALIQTQSLTPTVSQRSLVTSSELNRSALAYAVDRVGTAPRMAVLWSSTTVARELVTYDLEANPLTASTGPAVTGISGRLVPVHSDGRWRLLAVSDQPLLADQCFEWSDSSNTLTECGL